CSPKPLDNLACSSLPGSGPTGVCKGGKCVRCEAPTACVDVDHGVCTGPTCGSSCDPVGVACKSVGSGGCEQPGKTICNAGQVICDALPRLDGSCDSPKGGSCTTGGVCACAEGSQRCGDSCVTVASDRANCGSCGNTCSGADQCCNGQ